MSELLLINGKLVGLLFNIPLFEDRPPFGGSKKEYITYFNYTYQGPAPGPTDPTRRINNPNNLGTYIFDDSELRMHHLAWVRKDIRKKLVNWSAKNHFKDELIEEAVSRWENWKEGEDAVMLFNVPENQVHVKKLDKRMTNIKIDWVEENALAWKKKNGYI